MMPLTLAKQGARGAIKRLGGKAEHRQHLENLGFVVGTPITVVAEIGGNVIVSIKESRVALSREMASKIMI